MSKNILFVCKYNRFRSKTAEALFNKYYRGNKYVASSAGIILGNRPLDYVTSKALRKKGILVHGKPRPMSLNMIRSTDIMVIVADNVPSMIFNNKKYGVEEHRWNISEENYKKHKTEHERIKTIGQIDAKVRKFVEDLK